MKKAVALFVIVAMLSVTAFGWFAVAADYSDGYRVGKIIQLSHEGYVFKTYEGTLDFGYLQNDPEAGVATRIWAFGVLPGDETVRKEIDAAIAGDYKVKLYYKEKYFRLFWLGNTRFFAYKVERASA